VAIYTALAIVAAIRYKDKTGHGQRIDISLFDVAVDFLTEYNTRFVTEGNPPRRNGNRGIYGGCNLYNAVDGQVLIYYALNWEDFLRAIDREDLLKNPEYSLFNILANPKVDRIIQEWISNRTRREATEHLSRAGVLCAPLQTIDEMFQDPQVLARKLLVEADHPKIGKITIPRTPLNLSRTPSKIEWLDCSVGGHNEEVYGNILKFSKKKINQLRKQEVI
jgi:crotonobetainyl-CoA:carnitine CoA-transferase CaiB-like acyl-CoA transferase